MAHRGSDDITLNRVYREAFLATWDPLLIVDCSNFKITDANTPATQLYAQSLSQLCGQRFSDFFTDPDFLRQVFDIHRDYVPLRYQRTASGRHFPVEMSIRYFSAPSQLGAVEYAAVAIRDISDRVSRQRTHQAHDKKYQSLFEASPYPILLLTQQGVIADANQSAQIFYGFEHRELIGQTWHLLEAEGTEISFHARPTVLACTRHQKRDGTQFLAEVVLSYFLFEGQAMMLAVVRDVTELANMLSKLKDSEARWRFGIEGHGDALIDWPLNQGQDFFISPRLSEILGYDPAEDSNLSRAEWLARIMPNDLGLFDQAIEAYLSGQKPDVHFHFRMITQDGGYRWLSIRAKSVSSDGQYQPRLVGSIRDIHTLRQRKKQDQENREKMFKIERLATVAEMMSAIAHEVNQPLTAIANYSALSLRLLPNHTPASAEQLNEVLQEIKQQSLRAGEIVRKIRGFIQRDAAELILADIHALIERVLLWSKAHLEASGIRPVTHFSDNLPLVKMDVLQIEQVLFNLIRNAIEAMHNESLHQPRLINLRTSLTADGVEITVRDHGEGIQGVASIEDIFQPFVTSKKQGMGMGLAICKNIVEAHGGTLSAQPLSTSLGQGTQFVLRLPCFQQSVSAT